jgi:hypothetical protein
MFVMDASFKVPKWRYFPMATTSTSNPSVPRRAAEYAPGIGPNLDEILEKDVTVTKTAIEQRSFGGDDKTIVFITLDTGEIYHAWSDSLAEKIAQIPLDAYPLVFKFSLAKTRAGFKVLTFE